MTDEWLRAAAEIPVLFTMGVLALWALVLIYDGLRALVRWALDRLEGP